jgi:hypothetical protein
MALIQTAANPYKGPVGHNPQGLPIYLYNDAQGGDRYVVVLPNGQVRFSDEHGNLIRDSGGSSALPLALGTAIAAFFVGGPVAGLIGGLVGGVVGAAKDSRR